MKILKVNLLAFAAILLGSPVSGATQIQDQETEIEILTGAEEEAVLFSPTMNPPGSTWITVRCGRNSTCYPPAGFKFRHFNTETKGSDCRGTQKRRVKQTKDYIKTSRKCSVRGRVFIIPSEYCRGNYRYCS